jgi:hypothetical protein
MTYQNPLVGHGSKDIVSALMISDGGSPNAAAVYRHIISRRGKGFHAIVDHLPIDKVPGMQERNGRHIAETGCN